MAITGSGSLAISFFVFVISAAFLPKGTCFRRCMYVFILVGLLVCVRT